MRSSFANGFSLSTVSSTETPSTTSPCEPYCCCSDTKLGISALQGPHQVAQKSRSTTLPLYADRRTGLPFISLTVNDRFAGFALAGQAAGPFEPAASASVASVHGESSEGMPGTVA